MGPGGSIGLFQICSFEGLEPFMNMPCYAGLIGVNQLAFDGRQWLCGDKRKLGARRWLLLFYCHSPFPEKLDPVFVPVLMVLLGRLTTNLFLEKKLFFFAEAKELGPFFPMTFSCKNQQALQYETNR